MRRFLINMCLSGLLLCPFTVSANNTHIGLNIPVQVISQAVDEVVPLTFDTQSTTFTGTLTIKKLENLRMAESRVFSTITMSGRDMQLVTTLNGHEVRVKVGNIDLSFDCLTELRFDAPTQTLFIKPVVADAKKTQESGQEDIGATLISLLNGREFPVAFEKLEPIIAKASNKMVTIENSIADIVVVDGALHLDLLPEVSASSLR